MRRIIRFFWVLTLVLSPTVCFSWAETEHPISELLIHHVCVDSNYVFCGSGASWGTNAYGLFIFDRSTEAWINYPNLKPIREIKLEGNFVYVILERGKTFQFNRDTLLYQEVVKRRPPWIKEFSVNIDEVTYRVHRDSVILTNDTIYGSYVPLPEKIPREDPSLSTIFSHPVVYGTKIYMAYDFIYEYTIGTGGIATFDLADKTFNFYPSMAFKGRATGSLIFDTLIVFPTANFVYESNAMPAAAFVSFNPTNSTFSSWRGLPLPDDPLAFFEVSWDSREYWIGTNKGVFRIDRETNQTKHYQITKGIISKDGRNVYSSYGDFDENYSIVVAQLDKGEEVELLGILNGWCEIESPVTIFGWIEAKYLDESMLQEELHKRTVKFKPLNVSQLIPVKVSSRAESNTLILLDFWSLRERQYEVAGGAGERNRIEWYKIKIPTAWINMKHLIFQLGEVR